MIENGTARFDVLIVFSDIPPLIYSCSVILVHALVCAEIDIMNLLINFP